jgi:four helix bundle protein
VSVCRKLQEVHKEYVLSKQLLRAGTSIGANIEEAIGGQSRKDFYAKLSIAYKEARETKYWIRILTDSAILSETESSKLLKDIEELLRILASILLSTGRNNS